MKLAVPSLLATLFGVLLFSSPALAKTVRYALTVSKQPINMSGKKNVDFALMVNGGIPAPTLEFTEGDDAEIIVTNNIPGMRRFRYTGTESCSLQKWTELPT